jgi:hypothetical protein
VTSFVLELLVYPAIYAIWRGPKQGAEINDRELLVDHA